MVNIPTAKEAFEKSMTNHKILEEAREEAEKQRAEAELKRRNREIKEITELIDLRINTAIEKGLLFAYVDIGSKCYSADAFEEVKNNLIKLGYNVKTEKRSWTGHNEYDYGQMVHVFRFKIRFEASNGQNQA